MNKKMSTKARVDALSGLLSTQKLYAGNPTQHNTISLDGALANIKEEPNAACDIENVPFLPPMYSVGWRNSNSKAMESVIVLLPSGNEQEEEFFVTEEDGISYLNIIIQFLHLFTNPFSLFKGAITMLVEDKDLSLKKDTEFKDISVKQSAFWNSIKGQKKKRDDIFQGRAKYKLSIFAKPNPEVEYVKGETGDNRGICIIVVDLEAMDNSEKTKYQHV